MSKPDESLWESIRDGLIPEEIVSEGGERHRRARLIVYAVAFCVVTPFPVAAIFVMSEMEHLIAPVLLGCIPSAFTIFLLRWTKSTSLSGHYLTAWVFAQTVLDFGHDNGFSALAMFAIPILSCAMIGERACAAWTVLGSVWLASVGLQIAPSDHLYFGLMWSSVIVLNVVGAALVVLETTRTRARIEAERATNELYSQRERLRSFAQHSFPVIAETEGAQILRASDSVSDLLGYSSEEFQRQPLSSYVHPDELGDILRQLNKVSMEGMHCEVRMRHARGRWVWVDAFAIPYGPGADHWIFAGRSIDSQKKEREALLQAQRLESVGVLAAGMAHDFNNLLTVIMGFSELMEPGSSRDEVLNAASEAAKLTQQL